MKLDKNSLLLYVVTDRTWLGENSLLVQIEQTIKAGATVIQLREKNLNFDEFLKVALQVKAITDKYKVLLIINDNVDVAVAVKADGVHIGQSDEEIKIAREKLGPDRIIGLSVHSVEEAKKAEKNGADYLGVGAVFNTSTKLDANTVTFETLKAICQSVNLPVVAIGGISKDNILQLSGSGINGVAVISAIFAQPDITEATRALLKLSKQIVNS